MEIGIIGFGKFGRFIAKHLKNKADVFASSKFNNKQEAEQLGVKFVSLEEVLKKKIIVIAVSMDEFEQTLEKIKYKIQPDAIVLDVCSLKVFPCSAMQKVLPKNIEIIGTHPLFGPNSVNSSLQDLKIALCNVRASENTLSKVKSFCESLGLKVIITTPEDHDKQMAESQALTHFVCQSLGTAKRPVLTTKTFDDLMHIVDIIKNNTSELFENIQTRNPYAKDVRKKFIESSIDLDKKLKDIENKKNKNTN